MELAEYQKCVADLPYGKRLPTAVYVLFEEGFKFGEPLDSLLERVKVAFNIPAGFNILKFRTDELKLSFLWYPEFFTEGHPVLRKAIAVDLVRGKSRTTDYRDNANPPILHRKEIFLPAGHSKWEEFAAFTRAEEAAGLYEETATIGFKLNWERLQELKGVTIAGHILKRREEVTAKDETSAGRGTGAVVIDRHKTALTRYELSKPVKSLLEYGMLKGSTTFFDYGCGQGADVRGIQALGYQAHGWDPVFQRGEPKRDADVVNLGYVLNVIEDPAERLEALVDSYRQAKRLLVVSALITETVEAGRAEPYRDGVVTRRNTFQKYFEQQELQQYIEDALETTAVPVGLGVFYVFRDPMEQQDFLSARSRRAIDWSQISSRLGLGGPPGDRWETLYRQNRDLLDGFGELALRLGRFPTVEEFGRLEEVVSKLGSLKRGLRSFMQGGASVDVTWTEIAGVFGIGVARRPRWEVLCEEHREVLDAFWKVAVELGRAPSPEEFVQYPQLVGAVGSAKKGMRLFERKGGADALRISAEGRQNDLLVYLAMANLRRKVPFGHLSPSLRLDVREFFGSYRGALEKGLELLFAAGDTGEIELACEELKLGWQDEQALYLHRSLVNHLPPVLRAYVGCATTLFGDVAQADVVKLHKSSGKVTFLVYDDFEGKALPELRHRIKVNLRTRWVQVFDHSSEGQLLYFKERFLAPDDPRLPDMQAISAKLRKIGIDEKNLNCPLKREFMILLKSNGLNENLN